MLAKVDQQIGHIFSVMDIRKTGKVEKDDFLEALQRYPDLLEIFDFLNKGVPDAAQIYNETNRREIEFSKDLLHAEWLINNMCSFLLGEQTIAYDKLAHSEIFENQLPKVIRKKSSVISEFQFEKAKIDESLPFSAGINASGLLPTTEKNTKTQRKEDNKNQIVVDSQTSVSEDDQGETQKNEENESFLNSSVSHTVNGDEEWYNNDTSNNNTNNNNKTDNTQNSNNNNNKTDNLTNTKNTNFITNFTNNSHSNINHNSNHIKSTLKKQSSSTSIELKRDEGKQAELNTVQFLNPISTNTIIPVTKHSPTNEFVMETSNNNNNVTFQQNTRNSFNNNPNKRISMEQATTMPDTAYSAHHIQPFYDQESHFTHNHTILNHNTWTLSSGATPSLSEEEFFLKKYEPVMCANCVVKVTQKFNEECQRDRKISSTFHKRILSQQQQQQQQLQPDIFQDQLPLSKIVEKKSASNSNSSCDNTFLNFGGCESQNIQFDSNKVRNNTISNNNNNNHILHEQHHQSSLKKQLPITESMNLDPTNNMMKVRLRNIAHKFLGDLDESFYQQSEEDDYRRSNLIRSISPSIFDAKAFKYHNVTNAPSQLDIIDSAEQPTHSRNDMLKQSFYEIEKNNNNFHNNSKQTDKDDSNRQNVNPLQLIPLSTNRSPLLPVSTSPGRHARIQDPHQQQQTSGILLTNKKPSKIHGYPGKLPKQYQIDSKTQRATINNAEGITADEVQLELADVPARDRNLSSITESTLDQKKELEGSEADKRIVNQIFVTSYKMNVNNFSQMQRIFGDYKHSQQLSPKREHKEQQKLINLNQQKRPEMKYIISDNTNNDNFITYRQPTPNGKEEKETSRKEIRKLSVNLLDKPGIRRNNGFSLSERDKSDSQVQVPLTNQLQSQNKSINQQNGQQQMLYFKSDYKSSTQENQQSLPPQLKRTSSTVNRNPLPQVQKTTSTERSPEIDGNSKLQSIIRHRQISEHQWQQNLTKNKVIDKNPDFGMQPQQEILVNTNTSNNNTSNNTNRTTSILNQTNFLKPLIDQNASDQQQSPTQKNKKVPLKSQIMKKNLSNSLLKSMGYGNFNLNVNHNNLFQQRIATAQQIEYPKPTTKPSYSGSNSKVLNSNIIIPPPVCFDPENPPAQIQRAVFEMSAEEMKKRVIVVISAFRELQVFLSQIRKKIDLSIQQTTTNLVGLASERNVGINNNNNNSIFSPIPNKLRRTSINADLKTHQLLNYQNNQLNSPIGRSNLNPQNFRQGNAWNNMPNRNDLENLRNSTIGNIQKVINKKEKTETNKSKSMIFFGHQNWNLVVNMMMGIQMSVQSASSNFNLNPNLEQELQGRDFKVKYLFELLPRKDNFEKQWTYKVCKFNDYAPAVFNRIRLFYDITDETYLKSIGPNQLFSLVNGGFNSFSQLTSTGKSGSFFYYTADGQFTLKTVSRSEFHHLKFILKNYYEHLKSHRNSLIIKFFGLHKIQIRMKKSTKVETVYIVIMGNVFHTTKKINERYDLKGSTYGRSTKEKTPGVTLKDLDFLENKTKLLVKFEEYEEFMNIVRSDAKFFEENNIIDYSMLVGIHNNSSALAEYSEQISQTMQGTYSLNPLSNFKNMSFLVSRNSKFSYLFGIIDILTNFNAKKKFEYVAKRIAFGPNISAVPPTQYKNRFIEFMDNMFDDESKVPQALK